MEACLSSFVLSFWKKYKPGLHVAGAPLRHRERLLGLLARAGQEAVLAARARRAFPRESPSFLADERGVDGSKLRTARRVPALCSFLRYASRVAPVLIKEGIYELPLCPFYFITCRVQQV